VLGCLVSPSIARHCASAHERQGGHAVHLIVSIRQPPSHACCPRYASMPAFARWTSSPLMRLLPSADAAVKPRTRHERDVSNSHPTSRRPGSICAPAPAPCSNCLVVAKPSSCTPGPHAHRHLIGPVSLQALICSFADSRAVTGIPVTTARLKACQPLVVCGRHSDKALPAKARMSLSSRRSTPADGKAHQRVKR
jgi:hypothetical protein